MVELRYCNNCVQMTKQILINESWFCYKCEQRKWENTDLRFNKV